MHRAAAIDGKFAGNALIRPDDKTIEDIAGDVGRPAITIPSGRRICNSHPSAAGTVMTLPICAVALLSTRAQLTRRPTPLEAVSPSRSTLSTGNCSGRGLLAGMNLTEPH